mmetsp:Transcript_18755/g.30049  ORF Transcript_18755/g.30049 Transcript_18755/m.30049 type:complete len:574 (-) Transcript_18755:72-1793(-)
MTLRSDGQDGGTKASNDAPVEEGTVQMGTVRRAQTYGVFVTLDGSGRSGLCHISQFADARIDDSLEAHVRVGERVRVKVLTVDAATGRISLGMKSSLFEDEGEALDGDSNGSAGAGTGKKNKDPLMVDGDDEPMEDDSDDDDSDDDDDDDKEEEGEERGIDDDSDDESDEDDEDEDEDEDGGDVLEGGDDVEMESEGDDTEEEDAEKMDDDDDSDSDSDSASIPAAADADVGFDWDVDAAKNAAFEPSGASDAANDVEKKVKSKREKARDKTDKEMELYRREQALRDAGDRAPETAKEFEKLIMSSPRSSYVWLRYMAFQMSVGAHDEAREVAERALKAIPAAEEDERMNVWVAYLNLENLHGKPTSREALLRLFDRATKVANPKKLHLTLAGIYERDGDADMAVQTLKTAVRRYSQSAKVWLAHIRAAILLGGAAAASDPENVRKSLDRATQALPKRKHVKVLVQTALLEIREGSVERGRTMFESILRNYPRRTDIWSTYIDQEIKQGDPARTRALLERATHLELNPKSMKFLFTRYLDFERGAPDGGGDVGRDRVEHVKARAMEYVSSKFG